MATLEPISDLINIKTFLKDWSETFSEEEFGFVPKSFEEYCRQKDILSADVLSELNEVCSVNTLKCEGEDIKVGDPLSIPKMDDIPLHADLSSARYQKVQAQQRTHIEYKRAWLYQLKYKSYHEPMVHLCKSKCTVEGDMVEHPEVLLNVRIYLPYYHDAKRSRLVESQEVQVVGSQKLSELRDVIECLADTVIPLDLSENQNEKCTVFQKDLFPSGFFFIENVFYNDMRHPLSKNLSLDVAQWAKDPKRGYGDVSSALMEETTFCDLSIRLGQPYQYIHQGLCEHLIVFTYLRMMNMEDCQARIAYPLTDIRVINKRRRLCRSCIQAHAVWSIVDSTLCPVSPCVLCDTCHLNIHYDKDGNKTTSFKAFKVPMYDSHKLYPYISYGHSSRFNDIESVLKDTRIRVEKSVLGDDVEPIASKGESVDF